MIARLYAYADDHWPFIAAHYANINLITQPVDQFLNCVYAWLLERVEHDKREMFEMMLQEPLGPGKAKAPSPMTDEEEGLAFMAAMGGVKK